MIRTTKRVGSRKAFSLLEVVMGMMVIGLILVPTATMMTDALQGEAKRQERGELLHLARGLQSEFAHLARVKFQSRSQSGTFADKGHSQLCYSINCSDAVSDGGVPGRLLALRTLAWHDENGDRVVDPNETIVDLWTAVAKATP